MLLSVFFLLNIFIGCYVAKNVEKMAFPAREVLKCVLVPANMADQNEPLIGHNSAGIETNIANGLRRSGKTAPESAVILPGGQLTQSGEPNAKMTENRFEQYPFQTDHIETITSLPVSISDDKLSVATLSSPLTTSTRRSHHHWSTTGRGKLPTTPRPGFPDNDAINNFNQHQAWNSQRILPSDQHPEISADALRNVQFGILNQLPSIPRTTYSAGINAPAHDSSLQKIITYQNDPLKGSPLSKPAGEVAENNNNKDFFRANAIFTDKDLHLDSFLNRELREFHTAKSTAGKEDDIKPNKPSHARKDKEKPLKVTSEKLPQKSQYEIPGAVLISSERDPSQEFGSKFNTTWAERATLNDQKNVWEELEKLGSKSGVSAGEIQNILSRSLPGTDYPTYSWIPPTKFRCENVNQPGFYADPETRCQVIRRCDINGVKWNYLCPNATVFNQITLICDWFFNVDCSKSVEYYDYSNPRLYHSNWVLLDTP